MYLLTSTITTSFLHGGSQTIMDKHTSIIHKLTVRGTGCRCHLVSLICTWCQNRCTNTSVLDTMRFDLGY